MQQCTGCRQTKPDGDIAIWTPTKRWCEVCVDEGRHPMALVSQMEQILPRRPLEDETGSVMRKVYVVLSYLESGGEIKVQGQRVRLGEDDSGHLLYVPMKSDAGEMRPVRFDMTVAGLINWAEALDEARLMEMAANTTLNTL